MNLDTNMVVALIAAFASLTVAIVGFLTSRKNQRDVELLKTELSERQAERDARRDYEYEARKHLYQEYEPLLFQLVELSENALFRIYSLARSARQGDIHPDGTGWLSDNGYYLVSTLYHLLCPIAIFKLIQHRLTLVDLSVEPKIRTQYLLVKRLFLAFTDDFDFAQINPVLEYEPFIANWKSLRQGNPRKHWRQGLPVGRLDNAIEALIITGPVGVPRILSFGEFEAAFDDTQSRLHHEFSLVSDIFIGFHPKSRPILWRILIAQAHIYKALMEASHIKPSEANRSLLPLAIIPADDRKNFDWCRPGDNDPEVFVPFDVAQHYLTERLPTPIS